MGIVFYKDKKHFNSKLKNFLENLWTTSPPLKTSKHPQRGGGLYGRGPPRVERGEGVLCQNN
jgi:hypothetical protein